MFLSLSLSPSLPLSLKINKIFKKKNSLCADCNGAMDWMFIPSPLVALHRGTFGRWLGQEGGAFMSGIHVLIKETPPHEERRCHL